MFLQHESQNPVKTSVKNTAAVSCQGHSIHSPEVTEVLWFLVVKVTQFAADVFLFFRPSGMRVLQFLLKLRLPPRLPFLNTISIG